ncbi:MULTISPECIES: hypothetical protein [unclassified Streptomyces]|uniref:hypothetical protein n=1 Tax=unclassified Streptomyces TaxID=2593676 RepID=UPI0013146EC2|nr:MULTISPECIES: hypothetical protein [unclassified Streptomyces]
MHSYLLLSRAATVGLLAVPGTVLTLAGVPVSEVAQLLGTCVLLGILSSPSPEFRS